MPEGPHDNSTIHFEQPEIAEFCMSEYWDITESFHEQEEAEARFMLGLDPELGPCWILHLEYNPTRLKTDYFSI